MTNSANHLFQSFWIGAISPYEAMCMRSFINHGHSFDLYTYDLKMTVPAGVRLKDASQILKKRDYFTYKSGPGKGSPSAFSNLFRYKLLYERGGWWVDTDVICLSSDIPHFDQFFAHQSPDIINGAILYFEQGDPFLLTCIKETLEIRGNAAWGEIGPRLITRVLRQQQRFGYARPSSSCYPIHHKEALDLLNPDLTDDLKNRIKSSLFLHLWNEVLRRNNVAKDFLPPRGSLLRECADHHRVAGWQDNISRIRKIIRFGNFEGTRARLERAVLARAQRQLSANFSERGLRKQALTAARRAVDFDPHDAEVQSHLGEILQDCGKLEEAEAACSRAIELQPDLAWAHGQLSAIFAERGLQEKALTAARRAVECDPDNTRLHYNLGNILQEQDKLDEAVAAYQRAFELKPDNAQAQQKLDEIYASESFHEDALAGSQRAVDCDPG